MKNNKGVITLELLIALLFIVGAVIAVVCLVMYCQDMVIETENNNLALLIAKENLETARADSKLDFNSIYTTSPQSKEIFSYENNVLDFQCEKQVVSNVKWNQTSLRPQQVSMTTILNNTALLNSLGLDCSQDSVGNNWQSLSELSFVDFLPVTAIASHIDVLNGLAFISVIDSVTNNPDLYIYNVSNPTTPSLLYTLNTGEGINFLDVVLNSNGNYYLYIAQNSVTNQFQVVEFNKNLLSPPVLVAGISLPGVTSTGSYPQGRTIFYFNGLVYIATHRTAGKELQVYSVLANPSSPIWKGNIEINHNVNDLYVRKQKIGGVDKVIVYMATSGNADDLMAVDVTDPTSLVKLTSAFQDLPGNEDGRSLYVSGNKLFLGRYKSTTTSHDDFYVLDISQPDVSVPVITSTNLGFNDVIDIWVSGESVIAMSGGGANGIKILKYKNNTLVTQNILNIALNIASFDFESGYFFTVNKLAHNLEVLQKP